MSNEMFLCIPSTLDIIITVTNDGPVAKKNINYSLSSRIENKKQLCSKPCKSCSEHLMAAQKVKCNLLINIDSSEIKIYKAVDTAVGPAVLVNNYIIGLTV